MRVSEARRSIGIAKVVVAILVIAVLVVLVRTLPVGTWLEQFKSWVRDAGPIGYVLYALAYSVCCIFFIPAIALTLGAGAIFGFVKGSIIVTIGATIGATAAFLLARTVMRHRVEAMTADNVKFRALDRAITREGAKIVLLVRLAPIFPFTWVNYAFGLTGIGTWRYVLATLFGILPGTLAFVYASHAAATAASSTLDRTKLIINIAGAVVAIIASLFVARVATKAIRRAGVDEAA